MGVMADETPREFVVGFGLGVWMIEQRDRLPALTTREREQFAARAFDDWRCGRTGYMPPDPPPDPVREATRAITERLDRIAAALEADDGDGDDDDWLADIDPRNVSRFVAAPLGHEVTMGLVSATWRVGEYVTAELALTGVTVSGRFRVHAAKLADDGEAVTYTLRKVEP